MNVRRYSVLTLLSFCLVSLIAPMASAAPFTNGNVVVYRAGDGASALSSNATAVFLDEYTPAGVLVQSIALPTSVSGANRRLTASGTSTSEGFVSRSGNDQYLVFAGYDAAVGTAGITGSSGGTTNRVIALVAANGSVNTSTALTDFASGGNPRSAYSLDGTNAWGVGSAGGVRYAAIGSTGTSTVVSTATTNLRVVQVFGGQLYVSSQSGATRLAAVDGGTPTTPGQPITNITGIPSGTLPASPYGYFFADLDAGVAGVDTLYIADDSAAGSGGGIQKWCLVGGTWVTRGTITYATARGLAGSVTGTTVKLFATNGTNLATVTDSTGYNVSVSGSASVLATASSNTAFRGVAFAPAVAGNNPPTITPPANPIATVFQNAAPFNVSLTGNDDGGIYVWSATSGTGVSSVTVASGQGAANVQFTVAIQSGFTGTATFTATLSDTVNPPVSVPVNINVVVPNNPPAITAPANPIATVAQDAAPFTVSLSGSDDNNIFNWSAVAGSGIASAVVTAGQGTSTVTYTVTLASGFNGTATFTARLSDNTNPIVTQAVNINVTPIPLTHLVISQIYGGGGNSGATFTNDYVELYNGTTGPIDTGGWTIQYGSATGTTWQAQPLGGVIQPGEYYLIQLASGGANGAPLPLLPNVAGSINMSATAGKVALSNNGDPFDGCPTGDPYLVDLVGYGSTANCFEGATRAPGASNTTAIFRKNNGATDTNVNGSDFVTGAPNPRRTTPIQEIGPYVLNVDPRNNASAAPRDASMTITFTEDVTVSGAWFNISCVSSGLHNDATYVSAFSGSVWIITPNANFLAGEQCTATVYQGFVHDVDVDDSGPNTDTLTADYSWTFTVSTGTAPPYTADVHLTFGNPSSATADLLNPNNYLMEKPELSLSYNRDRGTPNWVSWHLTDEWIGTLTRVDTFRPDPAVDPSWYRVNQFDYQSSGFDRGHMTPNADRDKETSIPINQATFLMSNMIPQSPDNNQGPWADLENFLRTLLPSNELYIVAGPAGTGGTGSGGFATTIANGHVTVPSQTWKCALVLPKLSGDDTLRVTAATQTICVIMPNVQGIRNDDWHNYLTTVDAVEALTGYDLFANVPDAIENAIEAGVNGANPPGVDDSSVTTAEDNAVSFTLDIATPNANPLTYTIVDAPDHGVLSGTDANRTYTPVADFFGTDTFTFRVSSSSGTSNLGTVTITVTPVNDAPVAANDVKSTNEDTALTFPASDLTANDAAGPLNESTQSLTVTSVTGATLSAGTITYTPPANYNGPASFSYTVCDNGTPSLCATAAVNVTVLPVNDPPSASITVPPSTAEGSAVNATVSVTDVDDSSFTYAWSVTKNGSPYGTGSGSSFSFTPDDNGSYDVSVVVSDAGNASGSDTETVTATNVAPAITSITGPTAPVQLGASATVNATYVDPGTADTHTANIMWDDSTSSTVSCAGGTCTAPHTFAAAGVYSVTVVVSDDDGGSDSATFNYVVVVNATGGFVTGGGWIDTPSGKGTLNVDAKYQKNDPLPKGNTQFKLAGSDFKSTSYDWLVVNGAQAQYQGSGTINGSGSYGFLLTAYDGSPDRFRIRIWDKSNGNTIYDNAPGNPDDIDTANPQALGGGSIQVHN